MIKCEKYDIILGTDFIVRDGGVGGPVNNSKSSISQKSNYVKVGSFKISRMLVLFICVAAQDFN